MVLAVAGTHKIRRLIIEVHAADLNDARRRQAEIRRLAQRELPAIIEAVCEAQGNPERTYRIERLDLDLGSIPGDVFEEGFTDRLRTTLATALANQLRDQIERDDSPSSPVRAALEEISVFCRTGTLPWWSNHPDRASLDRQLEYLVDTAPVELHKLVSALLFQGSLTRLALNFEPATLGKLAASLGWPPALGRPDAFVETAALCLRERFGSPHGVYDWQRVTWRVVNADLVSRSRRGQPVASSSLLTAVAQGLLAHTHAREQELFEVLSAASQGGQAADATQHNLQRSERAVAESSKWQAPAGEVQIAAGENQVHLHAARRQVLAAPLEDSSHTRESPETPEYHVQANKKNASTIDLSTTDSESQTTSEGAKRHVARNVSIETSRPVEAHKIDAVHVAEGREIDEVNITAELRGNDTGEEWDDADENHEAAPAVGVTDVGEIHGDQASYNTVEGRTARRAVEGTRHDAREVGDEAIHNPVDNEAAARNAAEVESEVATQAVHEVIEVTDDDAAEELDEVVHRPKDAQPQARPASDTLKETPTQAHRPARDKEGASQHNRVDVLENGITDGRGAGRNAGETVEQTASDTRARAAEPGETVEVNATESLARAAEVGEPDENANETRVRSSVGMSEPQARTGVGEKAKTAEDRDTEQVAVPEARPDEREHKRSEKDTNEAHGAERDRGLASDRQTPGHDGFEKRVVADGRVIAHTNGRDAPRVDASETEAVGDGRVIAHANGRDAPRVDASETAAVGDGRFTAHTKGRGAPGGDTSETAVVGDDRVIAHTKGRGAPGGDASETAMVADGRVIAHTKGRGAPGGDASETAVVADGRVTAQTKGRDRGDASEALVGGDENIGADRNLRTDRSGNELAAPQRVSDLERRTEHPTEPRHPSDTQQNLLISEDTLVRSAGRQTISPPDPEPGVSGASADDDAPKDLQDLLQKHGLSLDAIAHTRVPAVHRRPQVEVVSSQMHDPILSGSEEELAAREEHHRASRRETLGESIWMCLQQSVAQLDLRSREVWRRTLDPIQSQVRVDPHKATVVLRQTVERALMSGLLPPRQLEKMCMQLQSQPAPAPGLVRALREAAVATRRPPEPPPAAKRRAAPDDELVVRDAGLVVLWPFFNHFFRYLGLVEERLFISEEARHRAVGMLHTVVTGNRLPPEHLTCLAKVLCGCEVETVLMFGPAASDSELEECERLLTAVIGRAGVFGDIDIAGFRHAFLHRRGVLSVRDAAFLLRVEYQTHDVLLDRLPWGFEMLKLPWMQAPLAVEWI